MYNILGEINAFLECRKSKTLEITFAQLKIDSYHNGKFLMPVHKSNSRITLYRLQNNNFAKMKVLDNLVFPFSFWFEKPATDLAYKNKMLQLPRPLAQGSLEIYAEKLVLHFTIEAPSKNLQVRVRHRYVNILAATASL